MPGPSPKALQGTSVRNGDLWSELFLRARSRPSELFSTLEKIEQEVQHNKFVEEKLYEFVAKQTKDTVTSQSFVSEEAILRKLNDIGIHLTDPKVKKTIAELKAHSKDSPAGSISFEQLKQLPRTNPVIKGLTDTVKITDWKSFTEDIKKFFHEVEPNTDGHTAGYIPVLKEADPNKFAISICSVDGQVFDYGDTDVFFSIQSCVKPLTYALACQELGVEEVHKWVGTEASGLAFNEISLNARNRPHNPMINSGAIQCCGLVKKHLKPSARFRFLLDQIQTMGGGNKIGFSQETYLGEAATAWRNNALLHFMRAADALPPHSKPEETLDFYLQCCSLDVNTRVMSVVASTLANKGVCPLTDKFCLNPWVVKNTLALMLSCGMYDYSGEWAEKIGLPGKSGVAGLILVVIPNLMGIAVFSPRLDARGNSVRGIELCKKIMAKYPFGPFEQILKGSSESDLILSSRPLKRGGKVLLEMFRDKISLYNCAFRMSTSSKPFLLLSELEQRMQSVGIDPKTPRSQAILNKIINNAKKNNQSHESDAETKISFKDLLVDQVESDNLVMKALRGTTVISNFAEFTSEITNIYHQTKSQDQGKIPESLLAELKRADPDAFGVSFCTVDGQTFEIGDTNIDFSLTSCVNSFIYALACHDLGIDKVHSHIGREPTSVNPHGFVYGRDGLPNNPFVDTGALAITSILRPNADPTARYKWIINSIGEFAGDSRLTFSQPVYLELKTTSHMLKAVSHSMQGKGLFPSSLSARDVIDRYSECAAIEVNCRQLALIAGTLANGGVCPTTGRQIVEPEIIKNLYSLLYSCGMNQFSGFWNFEVGIPAASGESGCFMVVIPHVMGLAIYSPRLNEHNISDRAVRFCRHLSKKFRFGIFDQLVYGDQEFVIPETASFNEDGTLFFNLANACAAGRLEDAEALILKNPNIVYLGDYDSRTALHLACSEGHAQIIRLLLQYGAKADVKDRWGNTPLRDLQTHGHEDLVPLLQLS